MKGGVSSSAHILLFLTTVSLGDGSASHAGTGAKNDRQMLHQVHREEWESSGVQGKGGLGGCMRAGRGKAANHRTEGRKKGDNNFIYI